MPLNIYVKIPIFMSEPSKKSFEMFVSDVWIWISAKYFNENRRFLCFFYMLSFYIDFDLFIFRKASATSVYKKKFPPHNKKLLFVYSCGCQRLKAK